MVDVSKSRLGRNPLDPNKYNLDSPTNDSSALGYAQGLNKTSAVEMLNDSRFIQDVYDFYYERDGKTFGNPEEAVEHFWSDRVWKNMNTGSIAKEAWNAGDYSDNQKRRLARIQTVYDQNPNFWEDAGRGADGFWQNAGALLADPANLIGFGFGALGAKAAARGAAIAGQNTLKAGIIGGAKRGAITEGVASGAVEGFADAAMQNRNVDIGLQDETSLGQSAIAAGIGAATGGILGAGMGAAAPLLGRAAGKAGLDKLDVVARGEAEGLAAKAAAEEANVRAQMDEAGEVDIDSLFDEYDVQLNTEMSNALDEAGGNLDFESAVQMVLGGTFRSPEELAAQLGVNPTSRSFKHVVRAFDANQKRVAHQQMKRTPQIIQNLTNDAANIENGAARAKQGGADAQNIDENLTRAAKIRNRANQLDNAYSRYQEFLKSGKFREAGQLADEITSDPQVREALGLPDPNAPAPEGTPRVAQQSGATGEGFTMADAPDEAAVRQQRADRGLEDPTIPPERQIPQAEPGVRNVSGEGFETTTDPENQPVYTGPRTAEEASVEAQTQRAEGEVGSAREAFEKIDANRTELNKQIRNLQQKTRRGNATEEEVAELAELGQARKDLNRAHRQAKARFDNAQSDIERLADEAVAEDTTVRLDEDPDVVEAQADEVVSGEADAPREELPTLDEAAVPNSKTEADTLGFLTELGFDKPKMRAELRARTQGLTRTAARVVRAEFLTEKIARLQAANIVTEAMDTVGGVTSPNAYLAVGIRALINASDEYTQAQKELAMSVYQDFLVDNGPSVFEHVTELVGPDAGFETIMGFIAENYGDEMVNIIEGHLRGDYDNMLRMAKKGVELPSIKDLTKTEQEKVRKVASMLEAEMKERGFKPDFIQLAINNTIRGIREKKENGINPLNPGAHEGRSIENTGRLTVNGKEYAGFRVGGPQGVLKAATRGGKDNDYKYFGQLVASLKRDGETLTGREAAYRSMDEAKLETGTARMVADKKKFEVVNVKDEETGKTVKEYRGYNANKVMALDAVKTALKDLDPEADVSSVRQQMVKDGLLPPVEINKTSFRPQQIFLGDPLTIKSRFPRNTFGYDKVGGATSSGRTDGSVFLLRRAIGEQALRRTKEGVLILDGNRVGRGTISVITKAGRKDVPNHEVIDGILYERVPASPGREIEVKGGFSDFDGGDEAFIDPNTNRLFVSSEDVPQNQRGSLAEDLIEDIKVHRKSLTQSTDLEVKASDVEDFRSSPKAQALAKLREYSAMQREKQRLKDSGVSDTVIMAHERNVKAKKKEIIALDPEVWKNRKTIRKAAAQVELAGNAGKADKKGAIKEIEEETGEVLTADDKAVAIAISDKASRKYADAANMREAQEQAFERFREHQDANKLAEEINDIQAEFAKITHEAPKTKPRGKRKPMVIKHRGIEVDLENHFKFEQLNPEDTGFDLTFLGQKIGRVETLEDGTLEIHSDDLDIIPQYENVYLLKRGIVDEFEPRIKIAFNEGTLKSADSPEEVSFHEKNHKNTNTYKNAPEIDETDNTLEDEVFEGTDERLGHSAADYANEIPAGRQFAIGIMSGPFEGKARVPSDDDKLAGAVLRKQSQQEFVFGTVEQGTSGIRADQTFVPFDEGVEFVAATGKKRKARKPAKTNPLLADPEVVDPKTNPIPLNELRVTKIDDADLPDDFKGKFSNLLDLHNEIAGMEAIAWNNPNLKTKTDYVRFTRNLRTLYSVMEQYAPHGVKLPNASRHASMQQIAVVMRERPVAELNAVVNVLRNLSGADSRMPRFMEDPNGYSYRPTNFADTAQVNAISIGDDITDVPAFAQTIHEIGHWSYFNILTPSEKLEFWDAMAKYMTEDGLDIASVTKRLPELGRNELHSPQEFFANQFTQWAISNKKAGETEGLMKLWVKVAGKVRKVLEAFFLGHTEDGRIDPDLIPLFQRILPDDDADANKFMRIAQKYSDAGGRVGFLSQKLAQFEEIKIDIERAIEAGDPEQIKEALGVFVKEAFAYSGKQFSKTIKNRKSGKNVRRVQLLDAVKTGGETADGKEAFKYKNSYFTRGKLVGKMKAIQTYLSENPSKIAGDDARLAEIEELIATQQSGDVVGMPEPSMTGRVMETMAFTTEEGYDSLVLLANDTLNTINEVQVDFRRQVGRAIGKTEGGAAGIKITPEGKEQATMESATSSKFRKQAQAKQKYLKENAEAEVTDILSKIDDIVSGTPSRTDITDADGTVTPSEKGASVGELVARYKGAETKPAERRQIANEIRARINSTPEYQDFESLSPMYTKAPNQGGMSVDEMVGYFIVQFNKGNLDNASQLATAINYHIGELGYVKPKLRQVNKAIDLEIKANRGVSEDNGIPAFAPANIQNALRGITHRDKSVEAASRTMMFRIFNLLGQTETNVVGDTDIMTPDALYTILADLEADLPLKRKLAAMVDNPDVEGFAVSGVDAPNNVVLNHVRKKFRKMGQAVTKGGNLAVVNTEGNSAAGIARTAVHEVAHILYRNTFDGNQRSQVQKWFESALQRNDASAVEVQRLYTEAGFDHILAEEYFVDEFAKYMMGRVTKTDAFGETVLKNGMERMIDQLFEMVSYVFNGVIRNKSMKQQFRAMTFYGDMFKVRQDAISPVTQAQKASGSLAMPHNVAPKYVGETIGRYDADQIIAAREFVGAMEGESLVDFVFYHGTPNGLAFERGLNPDVAIQPSGNDSLYGPGIYVTKNKGVATDYSKVGHEASLRKMIDESTEDPAKRQQGYEIGGLLIANREQTNEILRVIDSINYSQGTKQRARRIMDGEEDMVLDDPAVELARNQKKLSKLMQEEKYLWQAMGKSTGATRKPSVLPLFVRAEETFDMDANSFYTFTGEKNNISWILNEFVTRGAITVDGAKRMIRESTMSEFSGEDLHEMLVAGIRESGISEPDAKAEITGIMRDLGYDSMRITEVNPVGDDMIEALVLFEPTQVKHVDAQTFDHESPEIFQSRVRGDRTFLGELGDAIITEDADIEIPQMRASLLNAAEKMGAPKGIQNMLNRMSRGDNLTKDDLDAVNRTFGYNYLREQSSYFRKIGANWFGNKLKPSNGAGFFHKHNADLSKRVNPLLTALRAMPDYGNKAQRFFQRSKGLAAPLMKSARTIQQPASHRRILRALRQDDITTLSQDEKRIAQMISDAFATELVELRNHGYSVGDVRKMGKKHYVPQMWDAEEIRDNPKKFVDLLGQRFLRDRRTAGLTTSPEEAVEAARLVLNRILDTEGQIETDSILQKKMQSDPFYQRVINLDPDEVPEFEQFMVNDLEGMIARYFDKSTRKVRLAKDFGVEGHGFLAYRAVAEGGLEAAAKILGSDKVSRMVRREIEVVAEVEDVVIPALKMSQQDTMSLLQRVRTVLGSTTGSKKANKMTAKQILLDAMDATGMDKGMHHNYRLRVDAIVNAMADFPAPISTTPAQEMDRMFNVMQKRPVDGGDGTGFLHSASRKVRTFNAVTLLGWTTLTSIPDAALPLVRSGNFGAWYKGFRQALQADPEYRQAARDIGVGIENLIHDRMTHMAGEGSQRFTNAFFNTTLLTGWTNFMREASALVGFNALKAEAAIAKSRASRGQLDKRYKTAMRFLSRYGLEKYGDPAGPRLDDIREHTDNDEIRYAIMRFTSETIFTPDPNDVPLWAQTPIGQMVFQLKSFPLMMQRLTFGEGGVISEARNGNPKPLFYMATAGAGFGSGALALKDLAQSRGGDDDRSRELRERKLQDTPIGEVLRMMGLTEKDYGNDADKMLGWYVEGLMAMGGLGFLAELFFNSAAQLDNGMYGSTRVASYLGGPVVGNFFDAMNVGSGLVQAIDREDNNTGRQRQAARTLAGRVPVLGGSRDFREGVTDLAGDPRRTSTRRSSGSSDPLSKYRSKID